MEITMSGSWVTLYDVTRDGIGSLPWLNIIIGLVVICGAGTGLKAVTKYRVLVRIVLVLAACAACLDIGNCLYQLVANRRALQASRCEVTEGRIARFYCEDRSTGSYEGFEVAGKAFFYSSRDARGGGMTNSAGFNPRLQKDLQVRIWHRNGAICRLDAYRE